MAANPHHIDPTAYLEELLTQASPDLMRQMLTVKCPRFAGTPPVVSHQSNHQRCNNH